MDKNVKGLLISTDQNLIDINFIYNYLRHSYWASDRTKDNVIKSINNSLCFGLYLNSKQIGFARLVTDYTVLAYLVDVFIDDVHKGKGYGSILMDYILDLPELKEIESWKLSTIDAHDFYIKKGFRTLDNPKLVMEKI